MRAFEQLTLVLIALHIMYRTCMIVHYSRGGKERRGGGCTERDTKRRDVGGEEGVSLPA